MTKITDLTTDQFEEILKGFFAPPEKRSKLTMDEVKRIAQRLNERIDVPLIEETGEEKIIIKIILKIDGFLYDNLPNEFYDLIRSMDKGISDREAKRLVRRLTRLANDRIDIPYLPEWAEGVAIKLVIRMIINAARNKWNLLTAEKEVVVEKSAAERKARR